MFRPLYAIPICAYCVGPEHSMQSFQQGEFSSSTGHWLQHGRAKAVMLTPIPTRNAQPANSKLARYFVFIVSSSIS